METGHQVLTLGLASEEALVPLDSQIYVSAKKATGLRRSYRDGRSVVARRYREASTRSKPQIGTEMMKRAMRRGATPELVLALVRGHWSIENKPFHYTT